LIVQKYLAVDRLEPDRLNRDSFKWVTNTGFK
jgi:hypothetical protein